VVAFFRILRFYLAKLIWRLRYRLIVTFFFITVIPVSLILAFVYYGGGRVAGQAAAYVVYSQLDHQLNLLAHSASDIARSEPGSTQLREEVQSQFPGAEILVASEGVGKLGHGLVLRHGVVHGWASGIHNGRRVTILAPLRAAFFDKIAPELGPVTLSPEQEGAFHLAAGDSSTPAVPPPAFSFDPEVRGFSNFALEDWDSPGVRRVGDLFARTRLSALYGYLSPPGDSGNLMLVLLAAAAIAISIAELVSLIIGISITRTMTAAVDNLYQGTLHVMEGNFAYRIPVKGSEQIADLSRSFNTMTENVERLLTDSKEKERMQAELEIARSVQRQLFPAEMPKLASLELHALCQPARQVSGDYYDCQPLLADDPNGRVVIALGDVAGKGISAALLMASLQSTLRIQLREWQGTTTTERLARGINEHLYLNTAPEKYVTLFLAIYEQATGELEYTNAGHLPPMLIHNGTSSLLDVNGMVLGAFPNAPIASSKTTLAMGDMLVCYTDGVTELENEFQEQFGAERLAAVLCRTHGTPLDQVAEAILEATREFSGTSEAQDDLTMLLMRRRS
jgi:phosphoserine phosphatase RsbU/P